LLSILALPAPPTTHLSADGLWRWDGHSWQPALIAAKSPALSLIVSFFLPGVGSMINGDSSRGLLILLLWLLGLGLSWLLIGVPLALGMFIWGLVDAYQGAVRWNRAHGILS
jgi:TM2 domain-containing membrane protein YozV